MLTPCLRRPVNGAEMGHKKKPHHHWRIQLLNLVAVVVLSTPHTILVHSLHNTIPSGDILRGFENIPTLPQCLAHNRYQLCTPRLVSFINLKWSVLLNTNYTYIHLLVALFGKQSLFPILCCLTAHLLANLRWHFAEFLLDNYSIALKYSFCPLVSVLVQLDY